LYLELSIEWLNCGYIVVDYVVFVPSFPPEVLEEISHTDIVPS